MSCWEHDPATLEPPPDLRKLGLRLAALVLLIVFLLPLLYEAYRMLEETLN